jgi:hypothetical protein
MYPSLLSACANAAVLQIMSNGILSALLLGSLALSPAIAVDLAAPQANLANFERVQASKVAHQVANWILVSGDNGRLPFIIVDKKDAKVFVFYADGRLRASAAALLGLALGDDSVPGIGKRSLANILPEERTTPAGRFVASLGHNLRGEEILWVDYDAAISLHPVITSNPKQQREQRLATPSPLDNRISYGCINVPADFFSQVVKPTFNGTNGIVYVLPETRSAEAVFGLYDVDKGVPPAAESSADCHHAANRRSVSNVILRSATFPSQSHFEMLPLDWRCC